MAGSLTNYGENLALATLFTNSTTYLALMTANPGEAGATGSEIVGNGYARQAVPWSTSTGQITNSAVVLFSSNAAWNSGNPIGYWAVFDAPTGGSMLAYGDLSPAGTVASSDRGIAVAIGQLTINAD